MTEVQCRYLPVACRLLTVQRIEKKTLATKAHRNPATFLNRCQLQVLPFQLSFDLSKQNMFILTYEMSPAVSPLLRTQGCFSVMPSTSLATEPKQESSCPQIHLPTVVAQKCSQKLLKCQTARLQPEYKGSSAVY